MKTILNKKNILILTMLIIVDIVLIGSWIIYNQPDGSASISILFIIPKVFLANLIIAGMFYIVDKYYTLFFVINSFLSSFLLYLIFVQYIEMNYRNNVSSWEFFIDNIKYTISYPNINKGEEYYTIEYSPEPGLSIGDRRGVANIRNDTIYFTEMNGTKYFIYENYLFGYKNTDKIKVKKH